MGRSKKESREKVKPAPADSQWRRRILKSPMGDSPLPSERADRDKDLPTKALDLTRS